MIKRELLIALISLFPLAVSSAQQPAAEMRLYVVTIIDVSPPPGGLGPVDVLFGQFASDSHKDPGCMRLEVIRQQGHPNHHMILSVWNSQSDFDAHTAAAHTRVFREKIQPSLGSPFDERLHDLLQ